jgi:hypothetical protein
MPHSNTPVRLSGVEAYQANGQNCHIAKTYHGPRFTAVGKLGPCDHQDTRCVEGYSDTPRGRIDAEVCNQCGEVLSQKVIR